MRGRRRAARSAGGGGDAVLAVSSSGEFRDVVAIAERAAADGRPCVAVTADATSSLAAAATATVLQRVEPSAR